MGKLIKIGILALPLLAAALVAQYVPGGGGGSSGGTSSIGVFASLPACTVAGSTYYTTDGLYYFVCDGVLNQPFINGWNLKQPTTAVFGAAGSGSDTPTVSAAHGGIIFTAVGGSANFNYRVKSLANSAPYTVVIGLMVPPLQSANTVVGIVLRESSTGKALVWGYRGTTDPLLLTATDSAVGSILCSSGSSGYNGPLGLLRFLKFTVAGGGAVNVSISSDPFGYVQDTTCATTVAANFTSAPNTWGIAMESNSTNAGVSATWVHYGEFSGIQ
jgi:hypothetical protein